MTLGLPKRFVMNQQQAYASVLNGRVLVRCVVVAIRPNNVPLGSLRRMAAAGDARFAQGGKSIEMAPMQAVGCMIDGGQESKSEIPAQKQKGRPETWWFQAAHSSLAGG